MPALPENGTERARVLSVEQRSITNRSDSPVPLGRTDCWGSSRRERGPFAYFGEKKAQPLGVALEVPPKEEDFGGVRRRRRGADTNPLFHSPGTNASVCCCYALWPLNAPQFIRTL